MLGEMAVEFGSDGGNGLAGEKFDFAVGGSDAKSFTGRESGEQGGARGSEEGSTVGWHKKGRLPCYQGKRARRAIGLSSMLRFQ